MSQEEMRKTLKALDVQRKSLEAEAEAIIDELNSPPVDGNGAPMGIDTPLVDKEGYPRNDIDIYRARTLRKRLCEIKTDHKHLMAKIDEGLKKLSLFKSNNLSSQKAQAEERESEEKKRRAPKPKPKFDPVTKRWVVSTWDGKVSGVKNGHERKFEDIGGADKNSSDGVAHTIQNQITPSMSGTQSINNGDEMQQTDSAQIDEDVIPFAIVNDVSPNSPASESGLSRGDLIVKFGTAIYTNHRQLRAIAEIVPIAASQNKEIEILVLRKRLETPNNERISKTLRLKPKPWAGRGLLGCHIIPYTD